MQNSAQVSKKSVHQKKNPTPLALQWLIENFPKAFFSRSREVRPLQIGIFDEILHFQARLSTPPFSKKALREALNYYSASTAYLRCQTPNAPRLDLFGTVVDAVTEEQASYAQERFATRSVKGNKNQSKRSSVDADDSLKKKETDNVEEIKRSKQPLEALLLQGSESPVVIDSYERECLETETTAAESLEKDSMETEPVETMKSEESQSVEMTDNSEESKCQNETHSAQKTSSIEK